MLAVSNFEKPGRAYFSPGGKTSSFERTLLHCICHLLGTLKVFQMMAYLSISLEHFSFHAVAPNLYVSPKTEIYLDFSIKNAGFVFAVEIYMYDFSVFVYNFYNIVVELGSVA